jgi:hypothetical protein
MTIKAKPVVKNKYWIVEDDGRKVATIQAAEDGVVLVKDNHRLKYPSVKVLGTAHNIRFVRGHTHQTTSANSVYDYPCHARPYNAIYDLRMKLPLYTTSLKSKSYYCAGYYLVNYETQWLLEFCPKKIILIRNKFMGPFCNQLQAQDNLITLTTHK